MPTAVSLFSGCGGSDAGAVAAGFEILMANDISRYARELYLANLPATEYVLGDVASIKTFPTAELLIGCYPCQGFSQGGMRSPDRKINKLYIEFHRALTTILPKAFVVENVSGMTRKNYQYLLEDQLSIFQSAGYQVKAAILNASHFGVAQQRRRIFIVGIRNGLYDGYAFPKPTHGPGLKKPKTIRDAIGDLPEWPEGEYYDLDFHWYYLSRNRRRGWDEQSKTIVANARHVPLHPVSPPLEKLEHNVWRFVREGPARRFSFREAGRLQGFADLSFPDGPGSTLNAKYTVVGNAVPPPLFEAVVRSLPDLWD